MADIFGKYELIKKIAQGAMAEVYFAKEQGDGGERDIALKRLFPHLTDDQETADLFHEEAKAAASLKHVNIVPIVDFGEEEGTLYLAMEYVHGRDLRAILEEGYSQDNFIPIELAASLAAHAAAGLHYAHTKKGDDGESLEIVHRDICPQNILVSMDGVVKVCDFGVARAEHHISSTKEGVQGKFSYMAPEQIETNLVDPRSDVFALGIVLYETTTMTRLFKADTQFEALEKILYAGIEPPTGLRSGYPPELERIVMKALERDPAARYQTAEEMKQELANWLLQNQASTSPVQIARYMRGLFPELNKPAVDSEPDVTGSMKVSAEEEPSAGAGGDKKDVTDMNEDDLDKALDFALGAPSEAIDDSFVAKSETPEPEPEPEPKPANDYDEDATVVSERIPTMAELDASEAAKEHVAKLAAEASDAAAAAKADADAAAGAAAAKADAASAAAAAKAEADAAAAAAKAEADAAAAARPAPPKPAPEPTADPFASTGDGSVIVSAADTSGSLSGPPASRSGNISAGPPSANRPPPSAKSAERRAESAFGDDSAAASADLSLDDLDSASLSGNRTGIIVGILAIFAVLIGGAIIVASWETDGSQMEEEAKKMTIDPDMLVVEVADKGERVMAAIETTPPDAKVVVNGLLVEVSGGKIPLLKGQKNEVNIYAEGHKPGRAFVDGDGSGSPLSVALEPMEIPVEETADLNIMTEPREAVVWVDGVEVGKSPTTVTGLWTGVDHHVFIEKDDRYPYAGFIGLVKQSENLVQTTLAKTDSGRKDYVEVIFAAIPKGAGTTVNGEPLSLTPFFKNRDRNTALTVEFEEADSVPMRRNIVLEDVGTMELRPFLQSMKREKGTVTIFVEPMGPEIYVGANAYGQGPAGNITLPEGNVKVVLDTAHGRREVAVEVVPNTHTRYVVKHDKAGVSVSKKKK